MKDDSTEKFYSLESFLNVQIDSMFTIIWQSSMWDGEFFYAPYLSKVPLKPYFLYLLEEKLPICNHQGLVLLWVSRTNQMKGMMIGQEISLLKTNFWVGRWQTHSSKQHSSKQLPCRVTEALFIGKTILGCVADFHLLHIMCTPEQKKNLGLW